MTHTQRLMLVAALLALCSRPRRDARGNLLHAARRLEGEGAERPADPNPACRGCGRVAGGYLDFAVRVGLREAVGLVLDSNATTFAEFRAHVQGRGNPNWTAAISAVAVTWGM